jgi:hypothetical protein
MILSGSTECQTASARAGYTQISSTQTIRMLENAPSMTIRWPTNVNEDEEKLLFQT